MCPLVEFDFTEETKPLTLGVYTCSIEKAEMKISKAGNPYVNWQLSTLPDKYIIYHSTPTTGRGAGMFKHFVKSSGGNIDSGAAFDTDSILGNHVTCELEEEVYSWNGVEKARMRVKNVTPAILAPAMQETDIPF